MMTFPVIAQCATLPALVALDVALLVDARCTRKETREIKEGNARLERLSEVMRCRR